MGFHADPPVSLRLPASVAITALCLGLAGCGVPRPAPSAHAATGRSTVTTVANASTGEADHSSAVSAVLGSAGLKLVATTTSQSNPAVQILTLSSSGARATVTFEDDSPALRSQFAAPAALPDGTQYASQPMGFGGVSVLVYRSGKAVVLTLIPVVANGPVPLSDNAAIQSAHSLLTRS
jgi:hypothetical protein